MSAWCAYLKSQISQLPLHPPLRSRHRDHALRVVEGRLAAAVVAPSRPQTGRVFAELVPAEQASHARIALMIVSAPVISLMMCKSDLRRSALAP
jgi:hypothetical protein